MFQRKDFRLQQENTAGQAETGVNERPITNIYDWLPT